MSPKLCKHYYPGHTLYVLTSPVRLTIPRRVKSLAPISLLQIMAAGLPEALQHAEPVLKGECSEGVPLLQYFRYALVKCSASD